MRQATRRPALGCALLLTLLFVALSRLALRAAAEQSVRRQSVESVESVEPQASDGAKYGCVGYCPCTPYDKHCPTTDVPLCGSDGETYTNICFAEAQKKDCAPSLTHVQVRALQTQIVVQPTRPDAHSFWRQCAALTK
eukprot:Selendium_serpulae@DN6425_c1_g1_i1.p1